MKTVKIPIEDLEKLLRGDDETVKRYKYKLYKTCKKCGKEFIPMRSDGVFCSNKCLQLNWAKNNRERSNSIKKKYADKIKEE